MDRRDFLRLLFASPVAAPLLTARPGAEAGAILYLIADHPQDHLPMIIAEMEKRQLLQGKRFSIQGPFPPAAALSLALARGGWACADRKSPASLMLAFRMLRQPAPPSFALVRNGQVVDIRTGELGRLWRELDRRGSPSTGLTVASFSGTKPFLAPGWSATVYVDGKKCETLPLQKCRERRYRTLHGEVLIGVQKGGVEVLGSSCQHKICQSSAPARLTGERIVCAPNHFLLTIDGPRFVDTVTG